MNSRLLLNLALAGAVAVTAAGLYFKPEHNDEQSFALVPFAAEALREIEIERLQGPPIVLERSDRTWRMKAPMAARLDEIALSRVLDIARLRVPARMPAENLARFALDKPWGSIRFNGHRVEFGATNALTQEMYLASGNHVYAVAARLAAAVPSGPAKLLAHRLFAPDEHPVAFRLDRFSLRHDGTRWQLDPEDPGLSQDDLVRWADQWRLASSILTQPHAGSREKDTVTVELRGGRTIQVSVVARTPDLVLARDDEALEYHLPAGLAANLLTPPNAPVAPKP